MSQADYFRKALGFIHEIGIQTEFKPLPVDQCFLPGLFIDHGRIIIDLDRLKYPGDILHEAGHIAVVPAAERNTLFGPDIEKRKDAPAEEMMVIAWSYSACIYLHLEPEFVFHKDGYHGGGLSIIENFQAGRYIGVPVLQWLGMTTVLEGSAIVYPGMIKWMRN